MNRSKMILTGFAAMAVAAVTVAVVLVSAMSHNGTSRSNYISVYDPFDLSESTDIAMTRRKAKEIEQLITSADWEDTEYILRSDEYKIIIDGDKRQVISCG